MKQSVKEFLDVEKRKQGKCLECNETRHFLLEFAHYNSDLKYRGKNGKKVHITSLSLKKAKEEIKLGRFLCMFCHRIETKKEWDISGLNTVNKWMKTCKEMEIENPCKQNIKHCLCHNNRNRSNNQGPAWTSKQNLNEC